MKPLKPARRERSVSMTLTPEDAIELTEVTAQGDENRLHIPVESVSALAFALLHEMMRGRLDAVDALRSLLGQYGIAFSGS